MSRACENQGTRLPVSHALHVTISSIPIWVSSIPISSMQFPIFCLPSSRLLPVVHPGKKRLKSSTTDGLGRVFQHLTGPSSWSEAHSAVTLCWSGFADTLWTTISDRVEYYSVDPRITTVRTRLSASGLFSSTPCS